MARRLSLAGSRLLRFARNDNESSPSSLRGRGATKQSRSDEREGDMADKIRLGLIGASVRGTWSARSHLPALQASDDIELTAVCTTRADSAEAARQAYGARLAFDDWREDGRLARDRRGRGRRARAVALRADPGGARSRQARLLRMAPRPHHRGSRRTGGTGPGARAEDGGRVAGARRSGADAYAGAGRRRAMSARSWRSRSASCAKAC